MACGKAVITTLVGGIKDILESGKNGVIVNVNDVNMFSENILELLDNSEKRLSLGKNGLNILSSKGRL